MPHRDFPRQDPATREQIASELANPEAPSQHWYNANIDCIMFEQWLTHGMEHKSFDLPQTVKFTSYEIDDTTAVASEIARIKLVF